MNRRLVIGIAAVLALGLGWTYAKHVATQHARRAVDDALMQAGLAASVTYDSISASPFGSAVLRHVAIVAPGAGEIKIERLALSGLRSDDEGMVQAITIDASGASVPLLDVARRTMETNVLPLALRNDLLAAGVTIMHGRMSVDYAYDASNRTLRLDMSGAVEKAGDTKLTVRLTDVDPRIPGMARQLVGLATGNLYDVSALAALPVLSTLPPVRLARLNWSIDNSPLTTRLSKIPNSATPQDASDETGRVEQDSVAAPYRQAGVAAGAARQDARVLTHWLHDGGSLGFATDIDSPVPLSRPGGILGVQPTFDSFYEFMALTHGSFDD